MEATMMMNGKTGVETQGVTDERAKLVLWGVKTKMITSRREMSELTHCALEETLSGQWRTTLCVTDDGTALYATFGPEVDLDEHEQPIDPLRFSDFSGAYELIDETNLISTFDAKYASRHLRWCKLATMENRDGIRVRYEARICQPKDANHVLIEYETHDSKECSVPQNVIRADDVEVFRQELKGAWRFWILIPIGFRARVFDLLMDADCLKGGNSKISSEDFADMAEMYFLSQTEARAQIWREKAQAEYDTWRKNIAQRRAKLEEAARAREKLLPKLERMQARLKAIDWTWARFLEKIELYEKGMDEPRLVELPAGWKTSLQFYPNSKYEYTFLWLGKKYEYTEANVDLLEMYVIGIEAAEEDMRHKMWVRERFAEIAREFKVTHVVVDSEGSFVEAFSKTSFVFLRRRDDEMLLRLGPDKAEMIDWSTEKVLWTCRYYESKRFLKPEGKTDFCGTGALRELLETECEKRPILKRRLVGQKFVGACKAAGEAMKRKR